MPEGKTPFIRVPRAGTRRFRLAILLALLALTLLLSAGLWGYYAYHRAYWINLRSHADRTRYAERIESAFDAVEGRRFDKAWRWLERCPESERGWEWGRLVRLCNQDLMTYDGGTTAVYWADLSAGATHVSTADSDTRAIIWETQTGRRVHSLDDHDDTVWIAQFSPDGTRLLTTSDDNTAAIWDVPTGRLLHRLRGHTGYVRFGIFNADGRYVSTGSWDRTAKVWDAATGEERFSTVRLPHVVDFVIFDPRSEVLLTAAYERKLDLWRIPSGEHDQTLSGHSDLAWCADFDSAGTRVVTGSLDNTARIWERQTLRTLQRLVGHADDVVFCTFSPDDRHILTASHDRTARIWDAQTGEELRVLQGHEDGLILAIYDWEGRWIATSSSDRTVRIWDAETGGEQMVLVGHDEPVHSLRFDRDGHILLSGSGDGTAKVWDMHGGNEPREVGELLATVTAFDTGPRNRMASGHAEGEVRVWQIETGTALWQGRVPGGGIRDLGFDHTGARLAVVAGDGGVYLCDLLDGRVTSMPNVADATAVDYHPTMATIAVGFSDGTVSVLAERNRKRSRVVRTEGESPVRKVAFSSKGNLLAVVDEEGNLDIRESQSGETTVRLRKTKSPVLSAVFSPDETKIAVGCLDRSVEIRDLASQQRLWRDQQREHPSSHGIVDLAFTPDGDRIAALSGLWGILYDARDGRRILMFREPYNIHFDQAAFNADGRFFVTAGFGGMKVYEAFPWRVESYAETTGSLKRRIHEYKVRRWADLRELRAQESDRPSTLTLSPSN